MTGRHEFKNGVTHTILERERLTLEGDHAGPGAASRPATRPASSASGTWATKPDHCPTSRGFDEVFIHGCGGIGQTYPGSCGDAPGNTYFNPAILHNGKFEKTKGYCTDVFFAPGDEVDRGASRASKPFFCYIPTNAPHAPLHVRPEDEARYADKVKTRTWPSSSA